MKRLVFLTLLWAVSSHLFAEDRATVTVVADPWCPFNCNADNLWQGIMIDLAREALAFSDVNLNYQNVSWARAAAMVEGGQIDAIVGMGKSANTESRFIFPSIPLAFTQVCFYREAGSDWEYTGLDSLKTQQLGVINKYKYGDPIIDDWVATQTNTGKMNVVFGDSELIISLIKMLNAGRITTFGEVQTNVEYTLNLHPDINPVEKAGCLDAIDDVYIAFSKPMDTSLGFAQKLDDGMQRLLKDRARLDELFNRYGLDVDTYLAQLRSYQLIE